MLSLMWCLLPLFLLACWCWWLCCFHCPQSALKMWDLKWTKKGYSIETNIFLSLKVIIMMKMCMYSIISVAVNILYRDPCWIDYLFVVVALETHTQHFFYNCNRCHLCCICTLKTINRKCDTVQSVSFNNCYKL